MQRIDFLDGLRFLAVMLVVFGHTIYQTNIEISPETMSWLRFIPHGGLGVSIFFVISGFIITYLLLKEEAKEGDVSLKHFYFRRFFRIVPLTYIYILVVLLFQIVVYNHFSVLSYICPITFTQGTFLLGKNPFELSHLWSLAVEEQFYIFWPFIFLFIKNNSKRFQFLVYVCLFSLFFKIGYNFFNFFDRFQIFLKADYLAFGGILALVFFQQKGRSWPIFSYWLRIPLWFVLFICFYFEYNYGRVYAAFIGSLMAVIIFLIIGSYLYNPKGIDYKFFSIPLIAFLGRCSFSIYIWQQFFLNHNDLHMTTFPYNVIYSLVGGVLSYYLIEQFFMSIRTKVLDKIRRNRYN